MSGFYQKYAGPKIKAFLQEMAESDIGKQRISLIEEIDSARLLASRAMVVFEKVCMSEDGKDKEGNPYSPEMKAAATSNLRASLDHVSELVIKHAKLEALAPTSDPNILPFFVSQLCKILNDVFGTEDPRVLKVLKLMEDIRVPDQATSNQLLIQIG